MSRPITYYQVDVFTEIPFSGNGLTIFPLEQEMAASQMQVITREMRQFESIFVRQRSDNQFDARVFTMEEELTFAGHPALGAAAQLHDLHRPAEQEAQWTLNFPSKAIPVSTKRTSYGYEASMNQGKAVFGKILSVAEGLSFLDALQISPEDLDERYPCRVVSTGLPYLIIPLKNNFLSAAIGARGLSAMLEQTGAQFMGLLDVNGRSIRTGDNLGNVEDIATGSLVGPAGAYLVQYGIARPGEEIAITQGQNMDRESRLHVRVEEDVYVRGGVVLVAEGRLFTSPGHRKHISH